METKYKIYQYGMDDVHAMPDLITAMECAQAFNNFVILHTKEKQSESLPLVWACVQYWEEEDGNHADFVKDFNIKDWIR